MKKLFLILLICIPIQQLFSQIKTNLVTVENTNNLTTIDGNLNVNGNVGVNSYFSFINNSGGYLDLGHDQRSSFITGQTGAYIYSGNGPSGDIPAGTLILQSRSSIPRDIVFVTGSTPTERLRITGDGKIGIGTNNPSEKLHVNGNIVSSNIKFRKSDNTGTASFDLSESGTLIHVAGGGLIGRNDNTQDLGSGSWRFRNLHLGSNAFINGKVAIGTTTPHGKFTIKSTGTFGGRWNPNKSFLTLEDGEHSLILDVNEIYASNTLHFGSASGDDIAVFRTVTSSGFSDKMVIRHSGNVGIGITNPQYELDVAGEVHATTYSATTPPWSDFVFESDYPLKSLSEVESFIKTHQHLPDIPSEEELIKSGLDLPTMDAKLLQKIEELTLYAIEQDKENKTMQEENKELKQKNKELEERLTRLEKLILEKE